MVREIRFDVGLIDGDDMRLFLEIFKGREGYFKSRKGYDEYFFTPFKYLFDLETLERLTNVFNLVVTSESITLVEKY